MLDAMPCSVTTVAHPEAGSASLGIADTNATMTAELQKLGKPWRCAKLKLQVTNAKCLEYHARGEYRACQQCSIPATLNPEKEAKKPMPPKKRHTCPNCGEGCNALFGPEPKVCWTCHEDAKAAREIAAEQEPTPVQAKVPVSDEVPAAVTMMGMQDSQDPKPSEPSWDDFEPIQAKPRHTGKIFFTVQSGQKLALSGALAESLGVTPKHFVHIRVRGRDLAMSFTSKDEGGALKLTPGRGSSRLAISGAAILRSVPAEQGRYHVTITSWGCIVHLDKPMGVEG